MLLEAVDRPIRYHLADGREVRLVPGHPRMLPEDRALKLLAKAQGRVKLASTGLPHFQPRTWIEWDSPLFGLLCGEVVAVLDDERIEVFHPLTEKRVRIPPAWVRQAR